MAGNRTAPYDAKTLRNLLGRLRRAASLVEAAANWTESTGEPLYVFNSASQVDAMRRFSGFEKELSDSLIAAESGQPYTAETSKSRDRLPGGITTAASMSVPDDSQLGEEIDRVAKRGATKKKATQPAKGGRKKKSG